MYITNSDLYIAAMCNNERLSMYSSYNRCPESPLIWAIILNFLLLVFYMNYDISFSHFVSHNLSQFQIFTSISQSSCIEGNTWITLILISISEFFSTSSSIPSSTPTSTPAPIVILIILLNFSNFFLFSVFYYFFPIFFNLICWILYDLQ